MNYDTVYINGCSFFAYPWDWESSKRTSTNKEVVKLQFYPKEKRKELLKKYNFGWHLKENLNIKNYVNEASPGKSNEKIIRELKQYLLTSKLKNSIVILGLTQSCRYNVPSEGGNYITNKFYIEPNKDKYEILNNKNQCSHKEYIQFNQLRDKVYFSTEHYIRELELELDIIDKLLKTDNNKLIVINNLLEEDLDLYMVERKKYGQGRFALFKRFTMGVTILLTGSLGTILSMILALAVTALLLLIDFRRKLLMINMLRVILIALLLIVFSILLINLLFSGLFIEQLAERLHQLSDSGLIGSNRGYVYVFVANNAVPFLGYGLGISNLLITNTLSAEAMTSFLSLYLNTLYSSGIIGFSFLLAAIFMPLFKIISNSRESKKYNVFYVVWAYIALLILFIVNMEEVTTSFGICYALLINLIVSKKHDL